jgi:hypothetical protein
MKCNIDRRGRAVRIVMGAIVTAAGVALLVMPLAGPTWLRWALPVSLLALGLFQVFEGAVGWCALRAMGVKTRV